MGGGIFNEKKDRFFGAGLRNETSKMTTFSPIRLAKTLVINLARFNLDLSLTTGNLLMKLVPAQKKSSLILTMGGLE